MYHDFIARPRSLSTAGMMNSQAMSSRGPPAGALNRRPSNPSPCPLSTTRVNRDGRAAEPTATSVSAGAAARRAALNSGWSVNQFSRFLSSSSRLRASAALASRVIGGAAGAAGTAGFGGRGGRRAHAAGRRRPPPRPRPPVQAWGVPRGDGLILARREEAAAVGREPDARDLAGMTAVTVQLAAVGGVEEGHRIGQGDQDAAAVGGEGQRPARLGPRLDLPLLAPEATSQRRTVGSWRPPPVARRRPSGETATSPTQSVCPSNRRTSRPVSTSKSLTEWSPLPATTWRPSRVNARPLTGPPNPSILRTSRPPATSQILSVASQQCRGGEPAVGGEGDAVDLVAMPPERPDLLAGGDLPDPDGVARRAGDDEPAVGRDRDPRGAPDRPLERPDLAPVSTSQRRSRLVLVRTGRDRLPAVGGERQARDLSLQSLEPPNLPDDVRGRLRHPLRRGRRRRAGVSRSASGSPGGFSVAAAGGLSATTGGPAPPPAGQNAVNARESPTSTADPEREQGTVGGPPASVTTNRASTNGTSR